MTFRIIAWNWNNKKTCLKHPHKHRNHLRGRPSFKGKIHWKPYICMAVMVKSLLMTQTNYMWWWEVLLTRCSARWWPRREVSHTCVMSRPHDLYVCLGHQTGVLVILVGSNNCVSTVKCCCMQSVCHVSVPILVISTYELEWGRRIL